MTTAKPSFFLKNLNNNKQQQQQQNTNENSAVLPLSIPLKRSSGLSDDSNLGFSGPLSNSHNNASSSQNSNNNDNNNKVNNNNNNIKDNSTIISSFARSGTPSSSQNNNEGEEQQSINNTPTSPSCFQMNGSDSDIAGVVAATATNITTPKNNAAVEDVTSTSTTTTSNLIRCIPPGAQVIGPSGTIYVAGLTASSKGSFVDPARFKAKMCRHQIPGVKDCPFGERCVFAHTEAEMSLWRGRSVEENTQAILDLQARWLSEEHAAAAVASAQNKFVQELKTTTSGIQPVSFQAMRRAQQQSQQQHQHQGNNNNNVANNNGNYYYNNNSYHQEQRNQFVYNPQGNAGGLTTPTKNEQHNTTTTTTNGRRYMWNPYSRSEIRVEVSPLNSPNSKGETF